jgi:hypothetical protein
MNRKSFVLPVIVIVFVAILFLARCGGSGDSDVRQDTTRSRVNAPAPDNNSATNPSTADTAYQTDTTNRKDTIHR